MQESATDVLYGASKPKKLPDVWSILDKSKYTAEGIVKIETDYSLISAMVETVGILPMRALWEELDENFDETFDILQALTESNDGVTKRRATDNAPLTLDQLRNIGDTPVWVVSNAVDSNSGEICKCSSWQQFIYESQSLDVISALIFGSDVECSHSISEYGKTWWAYLVKPEMD